MAKKTTKSIVMGPSPRRDPYADLRSLFVRGRTEPHWMVALVAIASVVWGLMLGSLFVSRAIPFVAGWDVTAVAGASMGPAINTGDLIAYRDVNPTSIAVGQIVVFENSARDGELTIHRIIQEHDDGTFTTKGDASREPDSTPVAPEEIRGVAVMLSPFAGYPSLWIANRDVVPLAILVITLFAAVAASLPPDSRSPWEKLAGHRRRKQRTQPGATAIEIDLTEQASRPEATDRLPLAA